MVLRRLRAGYATVRTVRHPVQNPGSGRVKMGLPQPPIVPLQPDVLLGYGAILPPRQCHHPTTVLELADHAGPVACAEPDRMVRDLDGQATGPLDERLH